MTDFGLARRAETSDESRLTQEGLLIGTPACMAPEQVMGEQSKVGPQSDIYSLGVIFFEMLTSRLPFEGSVPLMLAKAPISDQQDAKKGERSKQTKTEQPQASQRPVDSKRRLLIGGIAALVSMIAISSFLIILLKNGNQTLAVHVDDDWLREQGGQIALLVDGRSHTISTKSATTGEDLSVAVTLGEHTFSVKHGDIVVHNPRTFQIEKAGRRILQITATDIQLTNSVAQPPVSAEPLAKDAPPSTNTPIVSDVGDWISLFDGGDVSRWSTLGSFTVKDRFLIAIGGRAHAVSRDEYSNFELEFEWKISSETRGGIFYRSIPSTGSDLFCGNEFQITEHGETNDKYPRYSGSLYGVINADEAVTRLPGTLPTIGLWNTARIVCKGTSVEHWLNGQKVVSVDTKSAEWKSQLENSLLSLSDREKVGTRRRGNIMLLGLAGQIAFRSIRIREILSSTNSQSSLLSEKVQSTPGDSTALATALATGMDVSRQPQTKIELPDLIASLKKFFQIHGVTAEVLAEWKPSLPNDYRPSWLSTRANSDPILYDAVATRAPTPHEWLLQVYDHSDDTNLEEMKKTYRPALLHVYPKSNGLERLTLWVKDDRTYEYGLGTCGLIVEKLQEGLKSEQNKNGLRERWLPVSFCGNDTNFSPFDMVQEWVPYHECKWDLDLSFDALVKKINDCRARDWPPAIINVVGGSNPPRFVAVIEDNPAKGKWSFSPKLTINEYRSLLSKADKAGGTPRCVVSRVEGETVVYSVLWDNVEL